MKERPILFSGPLVRAILDGRKTQTRRITGFEQINQCPADWCLCVNEGTDVPMDPTPMWKNNNSRLAGVGMWNETIQKNGFAFCPHGCVGDHLWVRETWRPRNTESEAFIEYRADKALRSFDEDDDFNRIRMLGEDDPNPPHWRPSIFLPSWASRITLEVTGLRVERLQEITPQDAWKEGISEADWETGAATTEFARLWDSINAKRGFGWEQNPWVWVVEFKRIKPA